MGLPGSFDDFCNIDLEPYQIIEERYGSEIREELKERVGADIPTGTNESQVRYLESMLFEVENNFYRENFENEALNKIYSSLNPQEKDLLRSGKTIGVFDPVDDIEDYDSVVLDHCVILDTLHKADVNYYSDSRETLTWTEALENLDEIAGTSTIYIPSNLEEHSGKYDTLGERKPAEIFLEEFETINMDEDIIVTEEFEDKREDLLIGKLAADLDDRTLILTYDRDFEMITEMLDVDKAQPILRLQEKN